MAKQQDPAEVIEELRSNEANRQRVVNRIDELRIELAQLDVEREKLQAKLNRLGGTEATTSPPAAAAQLPSVVTGILKEVRRSKTIVTREEEVWLLPKPH